MTYQTDIAFPVRQVSNFLELFDDISDIAFPDREVCNFVELFDDISNNNTSRTKQINKLVCGEFSFIKH